MRPPADVTASMELHNRAIYSEPDDGQYLYSFIGPESNTPQVSAVSCGEDNNVYSQGNAYSELDLSGAVCHEYALANTYRLE